MTTAECIRQRVSCRRFQETPIPREDIRRVVDLARFSPSWKNTQPVRYVVVDDPVLKERIARECIPGQGFNTKTINRAAALAVVTYIPGLSGQGDAPLTEVQAAGWEMFDAGIAAQTFCLAARELDIGTCILGIFDADAAGRLLELEGQRAACLIAMGYPEQWKNGPGARRRRSCCPSGKTQARSDFMTDHGQLDQDPQIVAFSPELLKLADRRRQALEDCRQAAEDGDANAAVQMGVNCLYGVNGVEKDPKRRFTGFPDGGGRPGGPVLAGAVL